MIGVVVLLLAQLGDPAAPPPPPPDDGAKPVSLPPALETTELPATPTPETPQTSAELKTTTVVTELHLSLSNPHEGELERLESYLRDVLLQPATQATVVDVVGRLDRLQRYKKPICRIERLDAGRAVMACSLRRTRVVRQVLVETRDVVDIDGVNAGLPLAILENDLKKRVLLRPGEPLDDESGGRNRIARQRNRIEDFLEREGYYGAQVRIDAIKVGDADEDNEVDVVIRVLGGSFVKVRRVNLVDFGPLSQQRLQESFGAMCLSGEGLLDGVFMGNLTSCFNRRRLQATTDRFTQDLKDMGYPEGRLRVTPVFVDARARNNVDPECVLGVDEVKALTKQKLPLPPLCVDLDVEVIAGNHVITRFHLEEANQPLVDDPPILEGTMRFLRETFLEPLSRLWQTTFDNPVDTANDTVVITDDMHRRLTFDEAGSVDEAEARISQERVEAYLAERGYPAPRIALVFQEYENGDVAVDYTIRPGEPVPVVDVGIIGNAHIPTKEIFDTVDLATNKRSLQSTGFLGKTALDDDVLRLRAFYASRGYPEADVRVHAVKDDDGKVHVVFVVVEGDRFVINSVLFAGGDPAISRDVLKVLAHCQKGVAHDEGRDARKGSDCKGNPLLPDEMDADARRVEAVYAAHGYPSVEAAVELGFAESGSLVRVSVFPLGSTGEERANPQEKNVKPLKMGEIFVEGNIETRREVLLREMGIDDIAPGSRLDPEKIANGVSRLRRTGLYSRVDLELLVPDRGEHEEGSDAAHVRVAVEERPSSTVDLSMGFSTQQLFSLRLEGRNKNLFGTMFDGSASMDLGLFIGRFSQVRTQIRWPRLLGTDLSLSFTPVAISYKDEPAGIRLQQPSTPAGQKAGLVWERPDDRRRLFSVGSSVALDWRAANIHPLIDDKLTVGAAIEGRGDWLDVQGPYFVPLSSEAFSTLDGLLDLFDPREGNTERPGIEPVPVIAFTPRIAYANIDNPFDPKDGAGAEVFVRTVPFALAPYVVFGTSARGYLSILDDKVTFAGGLRLRWGVVGEDSGRCLGKDRCEWALMQNDLLRLGGERTVRGVEENTVGLSDHLYDQSLQATKLDGEQVTGFRPGLFGAVANFEVRFSLIPQLFIGELKPALFTDIGLSTDDLDFRFNDAEALINDSRYAVSVGAGLRYVLPVGPLAVDVAYSPFDEAAGSVPFRVYVLLGYIF